MKQINECTDGRGCRHLPTSNCKGMTTMRPYVMVSGHILGCDYYEEKPPTPTLKEMIAEYYRPNANNPIKGRACKDYFHSLLRDIVDYAGKGGKPYQEIYKELGIEE